MQLISHLEVFEMKNAGLIHFARRLSHGPKGHPDRVRATYKRKGGTRYLYLTLNVFHQRLSGRFYRRKGGRNWLRHLQRERAKYPTDHRVYIIQDNLSAHTTHDVRAWARSNRVTLVPTATNAS